MFFESAIQSMSKINQKFLLMTPKVMLENSKQNFVFKATKVIPESARNSDLP